jgi:hypothetical protein
MGKDDPDFGGRGAGGNVVIIGIKTQKPIANASACKKRFVACVDEALNNRDDAARW